MKIVPRMRIENNVNLLIARFVEAAHVEGKQHETAKYKNYRKLSLDEKPVQTLHTFRCLYGF